MKPESKKNRGKTGASSGVDAQNNGEESCYDLSNLANALSTIAAPAVGSSATRKDGGSSSSASAYDFGDFAKELSTIEHKEKKLAALRSKSQRRRELLRMRHVFLDAFLCPSSVPFHPEFAFVPADAAIRPSRRLRNHPLVDFPLTSVDWKGASIHGGVSSEVRAEQPVVEDAMKEDGAHALNPTTTTAGPIRELDATPFPIMVRLSRIVSLGNRRRRHCRVVP